ncbi:MAG: chorismate mutase [Selenomonas sp.]|uniref:chorismate mutase n=1 Tax=Selenomonas sp. TaxID=2053611 RepID=UPI0025FA5CC2|nr:chorismate mutase [Selenomonas sp.]MCI6232498.1 chorismate mutase [Selenomonas sp.]
MRGIRGAVTVEQDEKEAIWQAAAEMVTAMLKENDIAPEDIGAAIFSQTEDLVSAFPSAGVRSRVQGFDLVPLFDARQLAIEGSIPMCIRALLLVDTDRAQRDIHHIYLGRARKLRPDLAK